MRYLHGKLFEKVILSRLNAFLADNNVIKPRQHGFRQDGRTNTTITIAYEKIAKSIVEQNQVYVVLRDVAKAFDKVWHPGL